MALSRTGTSNAIGFGEPAVIQQAGKDYESSFEARKNLYAHITFQVYPVHLKVYRERFRLQIATLEFSTDFAKPSGGE